jgi:hypothetical protein
VRRIRGRTWRSLWRNFTPERLRSKHFAHCPFLSAGGGKPGSETSLWHPPQWEGWTSGDELIHVRFRFGRLWMGLAPDRDIAPTMLFVASYPGEGISGFLRFETLTRLTEGVVDCP